MRRDSASLRWVLACLVWGSACAELESRGDPSSQEALHGAVEAGGSAREQKAEALFTTARTLAIVAHQDDEFLMMPDLIDSVRAGNPWRTVYLTAGNAGFRQCYWEGRQRGVEAAAALVAN